jgi:hypothetical protein
VLPPHSQYHPQLQPYPHPLHQQDHHQYFPSGELIFPDLMGLGGGGGAHVGGGGGGIGGIGGSVSGLSGNGGGCVGSSGSMGSIGSSGSISHTAAAWGGPADYSPPLDDFSDPLPEVSERRVLVPRAVLLLGGGWAGGL